MVQKDQEGMDFDAHCVKSRRDIYYHAASLHYGSVTKTKL